MDIEKNSKCMKTRSLRPGGYVFPQKFLVFPISPRVAIVSGIRN